MGGRLPFGGVEAFVADRLDRRDHDGKMIRQATRHDGGDAYLLDGRVSEIRADRTKAQIRIESAGQALSISFGGL